MNDAFLTLRPGRDLDSPNREANDEIVAILDQICHEIELPPSRVANAKARYDTIGKFLAGPGSSLNVYGPRIFAQGSIGLGTPVKPLQTYEFDVDLACLFSQSPAEKPEDVRHSVYNLFEGNALYKGKVRLLARCIQLSYADEFHMDIMPCVPGIQGQVLVPDRRANGWVSSNPEGYSEWFLKCSTLAPMRMKKMAVLENRETILAANAQIDPFPEWDGLKKRPLQRCTQLLKRHRDKMFYEDNSKAPSSVIITTLAAHSYAKSVTENNYDSTLKLLEDIVAGMPNFITVQELPGKSLEYRIENPVLSSENFASKWRTDPELPANFYRWHSRVLQSIRQLSKALGEGLHHIGALLGEDYGQESAKEAIRSFSKTIEQQRSQGKINIIVGGASGSARTQSIPNHTNFGRE